MSSSPGIRVMVHLFIPAEHFVSFCCFFFIASVAVARGSEHLSTIAPVSDVES